MYTQNRNTRTLTQLPTRKSPAAFYVYNSVRIITAEAVYDEDRNIMCATTSSGFPNINSNAEAYFGGPSIAGHFFSESEYTTVVSTILTFFEPTSFTTAPTKTTVLISSTTFYINSDGDTVTPPPQQPGVVISLTAPFIYQAPWGETGALQPTPKCWRGSDVAQYGYVPQTLLDFLIQDPVYSAQYPGLKGCIPGGPSIIFEECFLIPQSTPAPPLPSTVAIPAGGGLTSEATVYVMPNIVATPAPPDSMLDDTGPTGAPASPKQSPNQDQSPNSIGAIINSIIRGQSPPNQGNGLFSTQVIGGTPVLVIPGPTTIPLSLAPPGLQGSTVMQDGTTMLAVTAPTTVPVPAESNDALGAVATTTINGIPYLLIPSPSPAQLPGVGVLTTIQGQQEWILSPTTVPVSELRGLDVSGQTTVIGGVTEVVISSSTTVGRKGSSVASVSVSVLTTTIVVTSSTPTTKKNAGGKVDTAWIGWVGSISVMILILG
jgi:hypothetical protein